MPSRHAPSLAACGTSIPACSLDMVLVLSLLYSGLSPPLCRVASLNGGPTRLRVQITHTIRKYTLFVHAIRRLHDLLRIGGTPEILAIYAPYFWTLSGPAPIVFQ